MPLRREKGAGSVRERADGTKVFHLKFVVNGVRTSVQAKSKAELMRRRDERRTEILAELEGATRQRESLTVGALLDAWLANRKGRVEPSTWRTYEMNVRCHLAPPNTAGHRGLASHKAADLKPFQIDDFLASDLRKANGRPLAAQSRKNMRTVLHSAFQWGLKQDLVMRNPVAGSSAVSVPQVDFEPWTLNDARQVLAAIKGSYLEPLATLAMFYGWRQGEVLGLRKADVDFERGVLHIRRKLINKGFNGGQWAMGLPKTGIRESLPLFPEVAAQLTHRLAAQREERLTANWRNVPIMHEQKLPPGQTMSDELVFTTPSGLPWQGQDVTKAYQRTLRKAGMTSRRFHDFRGAAVVILTELGVSDDTIMRICGWKSRSMLDRYRRSHTNLDTAISQAISKFGAALFSGAN